MEGGTRWAEVSRDAPLRCRERGGREIGFRASERPNSMPDRHWSPGGAHHVLLTARSAETSFEEEAGFG